MLNVLGIEKAASVYSRCYFSEIVHSAGMGRWWARVFDVECAFCADFVRGLGGDERAVAGDDLLLASEVHSSEAAGVGWVVGVGCGFVESWFPI